MSVPYQPVMDWLPDRNGLELRAGDFVSHVDKPAEVWRVTGVRAVEEHADGIVTRKLGTVSMDYSHIDVEHPSAGEPTVIGIHNFRNPVITWGIAPANAVKIEGPEVALAYERAMIDRIYQVIEDLEGEIAKKRSSLIRREAALTRAVLAQKEAARS